MKKLAVITLIILMITSMLSVTSHAGAAYNYQSVDYCVMVDAWDGYVNFRSGPGLSYSINYPIYNGEILYVYTTADNSQDGLWWGEITYNGLTGWISLSEVSFIDYYCDDTYYEDDWYEDDWYEDDWYEDDYYYDDYYYDGPLYCPYDIHTSIVYNCLSQAQQELFNALYDAIYLGEDWLEVPSKIYGDDIWMVLHLMETETPELCAFDEDSTQIWGYDENGTWLTTEIDLGYKRSLDEQRSFIWEMQDLAANFSWMNALDGIASIHDYLISRFEYGSPSGGDPYQAYDAMWNNVCVCNAYAECAAMLCHFAGFSCSYVTGDSYDEWGNYVGWHAWNIGYANGCYFNFDATWDDRGSWADRRWFGLSDYDTSHSADSKFSVLPWAGGLW